MGPEIVISPKKNISPLVTFPLNEMKTSNLEKEHIMEVTFSSHIILDRSMTLAGTVVL